MHQILTHQIELTQQIAGMLREPLAGLGRHHAARMPMQELGAQFAFQIPDLRAERGLRNVKQP